MASPSAIAASIKAETIRPIQTRCFPLPARVDIDAKAQQYVSQYDRDGDGAINVTAFDNETTRHYDGYWHSHIRYGFPHDNPPGYSIERLARFADLMGNRDGMASAGEIGEVMSRYDVGDAFGRPTGAESGDRTLEGHEWSAFREDFGEERLQSRVDFPFYLDGGHHRFPPVDHNFLSKFIGVGKALQAATATSAASAGAGSPPRSAGESASAPPQAVAGATRVRAAEDLGVTRPR